MFFPAVNIHFLSPTLPLSPSLSPTRPSTSPSRREGRVPAPGRGEHGAVDRHRRGRPSAGGHRHRLHPLLEAVSHRQAGVPARRHDLHPAETEGTVPPRPPAQGERPGERIGSTQGMCSDVLSLCVSNHNKGEKDHFLLFKALFYSQ